MLFKMHKNCYEAESIIVNLMNQNKRRVWLYKSISVLTLQYIGFTHASLSRSKKVQGQKGYGTLYF